MGKRGRKQVVVVGGGISGLSTAYFLKKAHADIDITVLEKGDYPGGTAQTIKRDGYTIDRGPNGFLTSVPSTRDLAISVGLESRLLRANEAAKRRFVAWDGELKPVPMSPPAFLRSDLVSARAKLRLMAEPAVTVPRLTEDESVYDFAARRLGREFADRLISPMVLGITAGDARKTSVDALFPRMRTMEREYGSLFLAMIAKAREGRGAPGSRLTSFSDDGVGLLMHRLADALEDGVKVGVGAQEISPRAGGGFTVVADGGRTLEADALVLATPAYAAAPLAGGFSSSLQDSLETITSAPIRVLALGFDARQFGRALDGFGFLVPRGQGLKMLGCLWTSVYFPDRAPEGKVLIRVMIGGAQEPEDVDLPRDVLLRTVCHELNWLMKLKGEPELVEDHTWRRGIPQYTLSHRKNVRDIEEAAARAGVFVTGNSYRGVALNDCVTDARMIAASLGPRLA